MTEPNPDRGPVRVGINGKVAKHSSLSEIRPKITAIDAQIAGLLAVRAGLVIDAGFFKKDAGENTAPAQQKINIENAALAAAAYNEDIPGFSGVVRNVWETLVPAFVELQRQAIERTILLSEVIEPSQTSQPDTYISPGHRLEPEIWDFGGIPNYVEGIVERWERKYPTPA